MRKHGGNGRSDPGGHGFLATSLGGATDAGAAGAAECALGGPALATGSVAACVAADVGGGAPTPGTTVTAELASAGAGGDGLPAPTAREVDTRGSQAVSVAPTTTTVWKSEPDRRITALG